MTDCIEALFSSMSEKFNEETATKSIIRGKTTGGRAKVLNLEKDKTAKWRTLKRNTNARSQAVRHQKKQAERLKSPAKLKNGVAASSDDEQVSRKTAIDGKELDRIEKDNDVRAQGRQVVVEQADSSGASGASNSDQQPKEKADRDADLQVDSEDENSVDRSQSKARDSSEGRRLRRSRPPESEELPQEVEVNAEMETGENAEEKAPKRRGRSKRTVPLESGEKTTEASADNSGSSAENRLQRKRKQTIDADLESNKPDEDAEDATIADDVSEKGKKTRRSVRLEHRYESKMDPQRSDDEEKNDSPAPSPTPPSEQSITPTLVSASPSVQLRKLEDEKTPPKKRGRRAKAQTIEKQTPESAITVLTDVSPSSSGSAIKKRPVSKDNHLDVVVPVVIPKRSQRRIKPTSKILENIELGFEYDLGHSRITSCMGNEVDTAPAAAVKTTSSRSSSRQRDVKSEHSLESQAQVKKKLFAKTEVYRERPTTKPCPDLQLFIAEVKAAKWHHNKSPEDKKLSKKQQHKMLKQKNRHMQRLGLQPADSADASDFENSSDDNEEFIPSKRVQVGKTNVTLRGRSSKESTPPVIRASTPKSSSLAINKKPRQKTLASTKGKEKTTESNAENSESKAPDASALESDSYHKEDSKDMICSCNKSSQYYTQKTPETSYCCAVDHIEEQKVGCCNQLSDNLLNLLRPSIRVGYMILCEDHKKRFRAHNCCASCGIFCTQGKFSFCKQQHFFHPECAQKFILNSPHDPATPENYTSPTLVLKCPHCGIDTPERTSTVTMKCRSLPVFLPSQKPNTKPAKMGLPVVQIPVPAGNNNSNSKSTKSSGVRKTMSLETLIPESVMNVVGRTNGRRTNCEFSPEDMYYAIKNDDLERVAEILGSGYDVTSCMSEFLDGTCLHLVAHLGSLQMAYLLLCKEFPQDFVNMVDRKLRTASMCAVLSDKCDILNLFTQCGADLNAKGPEGKTCLHIAAKLGNLKAIQILVESYRSSRSVSCFSKFINAQDDGGWTAMVWAAEHGRTEIVSFLLNHGAEAGICDNDNNTVLHWATLNKDSLDTINLLLQAGTDCNIQNVDGDTPLHIACRNSTTRLCLALIENGADLMMKNKADQLPYDCIPREDSQCARTVGFNMHMRSFMPTGLRNRIVSSDISNGREQRPIQAVRNESNMMHSASGRGAGTSSSSSDESDVIMLPDFRYITKTIIQQNPVQIDQRVSQMRICSCRDGCVSDQCQCTVASVQNWYTAEGRLNSDFNYEDPPVIFECNDVCGCNKLVCKNRIVQNGIKVPLQVTECDEQAKGWGVQSLVNIPKGSFVAEYTGEILTDFEADRRTDDSYFFDIGHDHCIDANYYGNVSRFFNHSCDPNLVPVRVFFEHQDFRFPKIALFACKNISVGEEMCFDYGDKFWTVKQRYFTCKCLSNVCKYSSTNKNNTAPHSSKQQEQQQEQEPQQTNHTKPEQTHKSISLPNGSDH